MLQISLNRPICSTVVFLTSNKYRKGCPRLSTNHPASLSLESLIIGFPIYLCSLDSLNRIWLKQLPSLHCTVIGFALDWKSRKSLKYDHECLTELLERSCFQPYPIQRIQPAEAGWESDNKGFARKRGWVVCIKSCATFSVLVWC